MTTGGQGAGQGAGGVLLQGLLLLPLLGVAAVLPMLLLAVPELLADGKWLGAAFNGLALPGLLALVASVALPASWQGRPKVRWALVLGLLAALAACVAFLLILLAAPGGGLRPADEATPLLLAGGPLIVAVWNLWRLRGRRFALVVGACCLLALLAPLWLPSGGIDGCTHDYDVVTGEHTLCG